MKKIVSILPLKSGGGLERNIALLEDYCKNEKLVDFESIYYADENFNIRSLWRLVLRIISYKRHEILIVSGGNVNNVKVGLLCFLVRRNHLVLQRNIWSNELVSLLGSRYLYRALYSQVLRRAVGVCANGQTVLNDLMSNFQGVNLGILYNIIEPQIQSGSLEASSNNSFIAVGSNRPVKNYKYLIDLWVHSGTKEKLLIVGNEVLRLENLFEQYQEIDNIALLEYREDILDLMKCSKGLIHVSLSEGYSNVLLNAALLNIPVISTECSGSAKEILGERGYLTGVLDKDTSLLNVWLRKPMCVDKKQQNLLQLRHSAKAVFSELMNYFN